MSKKKARKSRDTISKTKPDLNIPLPIELLGTDEDPCFGKLFDPRQEECRRCGDSEICAIAMGQKNHLLRNDIEKTNSFKDLEELDIKQKLTAKDVIPEIKKRIRKMVKKAEGEPIYIQVIIDDIFAMYNKEGITQTRIKKIINKMAEGSNLLIIKNDKIKWKIKN